MFSNVNKWLKDWRHFLQKEYSYFDRFQKNLCDHLLNNKESYNPIIGRKYRRLHELYWIPGNRARLFHLLNPVRKLLIHNAFYIDDKLDRVRPREQFRHMQMLVIGCSGGLLTESMAELNFNVIGIDPDPYFIEIAKQHQKADKSLVGKKLNYIKATGEEFSRTNSGKFDVVVIPNVLEYDIDFWKKRNFLHCCVNCCKPGGSIIITTVNSSFKTFFWTMAFGVEPYFNAVNHRWYRATSPAVLQRILENSNCRTVETRAIKFLRNEVHFELGDEIEAWYYLRAIKDSSKIT